MLTSSFAATTITRTTQRSICSVSAEAHSPYASWLRSSWNKVWWSPTRTYRAQGYHSVWRVEVLFRAVRDYILVPLLDRLLGNKAYEKVTRKEIPSIEFIGVWDTVAAYGFPIDEMTRGIGNWGTAARTSKPRLGHARKIRQARSCTG
jgi:Uncharacterized alpha/beta hydrolase domain (DUF2235)